MSGSLDDGSAVAAEKLAMLKSRACEAPGDVTGCGKERELGFGRMISLMLSGLRLQICCMSGPSKSLLQDIFVVVWDDSLQVALLLSCTTV